MNFREELIEKAKRNFIDTMDLTEDFNEIKRKMYEVASNRSFEIELIKFNKKIVAINSNYRNHIILIPVQINPQFLIPVFMKEFESWGFDSDKIEFVEDYNCDRTKITFTLNW